MYAGLRYGLALHTSRVPALCFSTPRRPLAVLLRCDLHGAAERQMEEEDGEEGTSKQELQHAAADRSRAMGADNCLPPPRNITHKPLQNGHHQNGSDQNGDAASALPWDVLAKIPHPKRAESNLAGLADSGVRLSKKDSPLARTLNSAPLSQSPAATVGGATAIMRAPRKAGWSAEFLGDSGASEGIGYGNADERYDSFGRALTTPGQTNGYAAVASRARQSDPPTQITPPTPPKWTPPPSSQAAVNMRPQRSGVSQQQQQPSPFPDTLALPPHRQTTAQRPVPPGLPHGPARLAPEPRSAFGRDTSEPRRHQAGSRRSNHLSEAVEQLPLQPPPPEWNKPQRQRIGSGLLQSMKGKLDRGSGRSGQANNQKKAQAQAPSREQTDTPWSALGNMAGLNGDTGGRSSFAPHLARADRYLDDHRAIVPPRPSARQKKTNTQERTVQTPPIPVTMKELGLILSKKVHHVAKAMRALGRNPRLITMVDPDLAEEVAMELGLMPVRAKPREWDVKRTVVTEEIADSLAPRPPVVSVMGHVDHGKTTLLDALRTSKVAGTEAAGITQKIGAFSVNVKESAVTFFDTPGHAAFKSMRHSTSRLTDIVLVVIAADDGVKAQTLEVLSLLKEFPNLAPVVAVTKIDRPGVDAKEATDRISRELMHHDVMTEEYGGEVPIVPVSAVTQKGFDDLLEILLLQAEIMELRADAKAPGEGVVVESSVVKGRGIVTDMLVSWGKLKVGDIVLSGMEFGKVKSMTGSDGSTLKEAETAEPVRVIGFKGLPKMGDDVVVVESEEQARTIIGERERERQRAQMEDQGEFIAAKRAKEEAAQAIKMEAKNAVRRREKAIYDARIALGLSKEKPDDEKAKRTAEAARVRAEDCIVQATAAEARAKNPYEEVDEGGPKSCNAVFKAEGFGMLEAMTQVLDGVPQDEVKLNVIRSGVGPVTQSDVDAAATAGAPIFAFNVGVERPDVKNMAKRNGVQLFTHKVIYRFLDDVKVLMSDLLPPDMKETLMGEGGILEVFDTKGKQGERVYIAGTNVTSGKLTRTHLFRVIRDGQVLKDGLKVSSMRRFKDRVNEVAKGKECGLALDGFADLQEGDLIQCYSLNEVKRSL